MGFGANESIDNSGSEDKNKVESLLCLYDQWKVLLRTARKELKSNMTESNMGLIIETLVKSKEISKLYSEIRERITLDNYVKLRVDACEFLSKDLLKIVHERIYTGPREVQNQFNELFGFDSPYSFGPPPQISSRLGHHPKPTLVTASRVEAAAELVAKEAEYKARMEELKRKRRIREQEEQRKALEAQRELERREELERERRDREELEKRQREELERRDQEEQQRRELERHEREEQQRYELEQLQAEEDIKVARAQLEMYNQVIQQKGVIQVDYNLSTQHMPEDNVCPIEIHDCREKSNSTPEVTSLTPITLGETDTKGHEITVNELPPTTPTEMIRVGNMEGKTGTEEVSPNTMAVNTQKISQGHKMPIPFKERHSSIGNDQQASEKLNYIKGQLKDKRFKDHDTKVKIKVNVEDVMVGEGVLKVGGLVMVGEGLYRLYLPLILRLLNVSGVT